MINCPVVKSLSALLIQGVGDSFAGFELDAETGRDKAGCACFGVAARTGRLVPGDKGAEVL